MEKDDLEGCPTMHYGSFVTLHLVSFASALSFCPCPCPCPCPLFSALGCQLAGGAEALKSRRGRVNFKSTDEASGEELHTPLPDRTYTMAARLRHSTVPPTPGPASSRGPGSGGGAALPDYQLPLFPLNAAAQRALASLLSKHNTRKFEESIDNAQAELGQAVGDIYERFNEKEGLVSKRRKRFEEGTREGDEAEIRSQEEDLERLREKVKQMNERMEEQMRKLVDAKSSVKHVQEAVVAAEQDARANANASTQASTQQGRALRSRRNGEHGDDEDGGEDDVHDFTPTDPAGGTQPPTAPKDVFQKRLEAAKQRYQGQSLTERYAENSAYADFRRVLHDGLYPDDDVEIPPPDQWFDEGGRPAPGVTRRTQNEDDSDDDIAVERTTISTKCPLTLREFEEPLSSKKCPHTFEKTAILGYIRRSQQRNPRGKPYVQCPVPGCQEQLTEADTHSDQVLARKIKRLQAAKKAAEEGEDDDDDAHPDGTQRRGHIIDSDAVDIDELDDVPSVGMKSEPRSSRVSALRQEQCNAPPQPSQVIDMGDDPDDGDGDEDMEE